MHRLLEKTAEQKSGGFRSAAVETERKFVEVVVELEGTDCTVVNSQPPPIEKSGHAVNAGMTIWAGSLLADRQVLEADVCETVVGSPAVGLGRRPWAYR